MFPGMFMKKPDKAAALKQLKSHVAAFGAWVVVLRATPYDLYLGSVMLGLGGAACGHDDSTAFLLFL
ncbi:hypothetical protein Leryth_018761 [Lithospermum erythrorhizon]|nr:hypothetical protein Leryth_018761 [Lithospermum erythrorhizon]